MNLSSFFSIWEVSNASENEVFCMGRCLTIALLAWMAIDNNLLWVTCLCVGLLGLLPMSKHQDLPSARLLWGHACAWGTSLVGSNTMRITSLAKKKNLSASGDQTEQLSEIGVTMPDTYRNLGFRFRNCMSSPWKMKWVILQRELSWWWRGLKIKAPVWHELADE